MKFLKLSCILLCFVFIMSITVGCGILGSFTQKPSESASPINTESAAFLWEKQTEPGSQNTANPETPQNTPEESETPEASASQNPVQEPTEKPSESIAPYAGVDVWLKMSLEEQYALNRRFSNVMMTEFDIDNYDEETVFLWAFWTNFRRIGNYELNQITDYEIELIVTESDINNLLRDMYNISLGVMNVPEYEYRNGEYVFIVPPTGFYDTPVSRIESFVGNPDGSYTLEIANYDVEYAEGEDSLFYPDLNLETLDNTITEVYYLGRSKAVVFPFNEGGSTVFKILRYENTEVNDPIIIN